MPVEKIIAENGRVLRYNIIGNWVIDDLLNLFPEDIAYRTQAPNKVHTLIDVTRMRGIPVGWLRTRNAPGLTHPNSGQFIVVGISPAARNLVEVVAKLARTTRIAFFDREEHALKYVREFIQNESISRIG